MHLAWYPSFQRTVAESGRSTLTGPRKWASYPNLRMAHVPDILQYQTTGAAVSFCVFFGFVILLNRGFQRLLSSSQSQKRTSNCGTRIRTNGRVSTQESARPTDKNLVQDAKAFKSTLSCVSHPETHHLFRGWLL